MDIIRDTGGKPRGDDAIHPGHSLVAAQEWPEIADELGLTIREWQVCILLFQGQTRESIANRLSISTRTVRQYLEQMHRKLDVCDRVELVLRVVQCRDRIRAGQRTTRT